VVTSICPSSSISPTVKLFCGASGEGAEFRAVMELISAHHAEGGAVIACRVVD
jgi:hypothetical protein